MIHRFYKEDGIWYIDLPEFLEKGLGTKANLMMVAGADTLLDYLSDVRGTIDVVLEISETELENPLLILHSIGKGVDEEELAKYGHPKVDTGMYYEALPINHLLWLCPVTEYVFGGHYPQTIYVKMLAK